MPDNDFRSARSVISELGPVVRDDVHLQAILKRLKPAQARIVYTEIKPYLKFAPREFRQLMRMKVKVAHA